MATGDSLLWMPDAERIAQSRLTAFTHFSASRHGRNLDAYHALHSWSTQAPAEFWRAVWDFCGVIGDPGARVVQDIEQMPGARFFPEARLNYAENLLRRDDDRPAITAVTEDGDQRTITWRQLRRQVGQVASSLKAEGVRPGDRVCAVVANVPEAIIAALGAAAIGAIWSSCSPDFGVAGIVDRFGQIEPVVMFVVDAYRYGGKHFDVTAKARDVVTRIPSLQRVVRIPFAGDGGPLTSGERWWDDWLAPASDAPIAFEPFPFSHPLYILFSSGTTGVPKCIVHSAGGTLLEHLKEHQIHCDVREGDRVFYFTTCGWMMWNWLVSVLASGATAVLYDGAPFFPDGHRLFALADAKRVTLFGTSAKFIDAVHKAGLVPRESHDLGSVRTITSTGSPLLPESFDFVYESIKRDVHLASISGGTDIVGCFVNGVPTLPVWRGEIQAAGLGMDVAVFDAEGRATVGAPGELVCRRPFPSMPIAFWNDPDDAKYRAAYFARFSSVWCHGDWVEKTPHEGFIIYGRSDATLNPGGVRIGTAEIYRQVEQIPEVIESLAVGQQWDGDERIVLFVRLAPGVTLDEPLRKRISLRIRENTSPRHVPARIVQVTDLPRTRSGKLVELAVRQVIHGRSVANLEALANPEALDQFRNLEVLRS